jgi:Flp pilus assembly protein TadB
MIAVIAVFVAVLALDLAFSYWRHVRRRRRLAAERYQRELVIHEHWMRWCHDARRSIRNGAPIRPWIEPTIGEAE